MTDEDAKAIIDDLEREDACLEYLKANVQATRAITREIAGEDAPHEAEPGMLAALLTAEVVFLNSHWWKSEWPEDARKTTALCVNCNDVFAWACADAEGLDYAEIEDLYDHWVRDPSWGAAVWCIKKRGQMPQKPVADKIQAGGIWILEEFGLARNTQNAQVRAALAEAVRNDKKE